MAYNPNTLQQQLQDLSRQYQSLVGQQIIPTSPVQIPVLPHQIQYVEGLNGATLYQTNMPSNSSEIILDKDEDIFYKVSKDANGIPAKKIIRCRFTIEEIQSDEPDFLTRKDFEEFKEELRQMFSAQSSTPLKVETKSLKKSSGDVMHEQSV